MEIGLKGIASTMERGMQDAMKDVDEVQSEVKRVLRADRFAFAFFGCDFLEWCFFSSGCGLTNYYSPLLLQFGCLSPRERYRRGCPL